MMDKLNWDLLKKLASLVFKRVTIPNKSVIVDIFTSKALEDRFRSKDCLLHYGDTLCRVEIPKETFAVLSDGCYEPKDYTLHFRRWFGKFHSDPVLTASEFVRI